MILGRSSIVAMTIAEVFLLLMFVVWLGATITGKPGKGTVQAAILEKQLEHREVELLRLREQDKELRDTIEALRIMVGADSTKLDELIRAYKQRIADVQEAAKRGKPKCVDDNVLVAVEAAHGGAKTVVATRDSTVLDWIAKRGVDASTGDEISETMSSHLFEATQAWYATRDCRFDYRLSYVTPEDYHRARETFEVLYYPAGIRRQ
jgi:hypothetical protein